MTAALMRLLCSTEAISQVSQKIDRAARPATWRYAPRRCLWNWSGSTEITAVSPVRQWRASRSDDPKPPLASAVPRNRGTCSQPATAFGAKPLDFAPLQLRPTENHRLRAFDRPGSCEADICAARLLMFIGTGYRGPLTSLRPVAREPVKASHPYNLGRQPGWRSLKTLLFRP